jgi:outer membrane protein
VINGQEPKSSRDILEHQDQFQVMMLQLINYQSLRVIMKKFVNLFLTVSALLISASASAELKVGYIEMSQVLQSPQALEIGKKLQTEFASRANQIDQSKKSLADKQAALEKDSKKLSEAELRTRGKQVSDLGIELERKQRELSEDFNIRRNEEIPRSGQ